MRSIQGFCRLSTRARPTEIGGELAQPLDDSNKSRKVQHVSDTYGQVLSSSLLILKCDGHGGILCCSPAAWASAMSEPEPGPERPTGSM
jgi:hypothetical protein